MDEDEPYSEEIVFSDHGVRMAEIRPDGSVVHHDNWTIDMFGGALPNVGDYVTTLWDPDKPEPAESYQVVERHWIGELKGDSCWWLLLRAVQPTKEQRRLFKVARDQSRETRALRQQTYTQLAAQRLLARELETRRAAGNAARQSSRKGNPKPKPKPKPKPGRSET